MHEFCLLYQIADLGLRISDCHSVGTALLDKFKIHNSNTDNESNYTKSADKCKKKFFIRGQGSGFRELVYQEIWV